MFSFNYEVIDRGRVPRAVARGRLTQVGVAMLRALFCRLQMAVRFFKVMLPKLSNIKLWHSNHWHIYPCVKVVGMHTVPIAQAPALRSLL